MSADTVAAEKERIRRLAYRRLREAGAARFPFPPEGRIPNFKGAEAAARHLAALDVYRRATSIKVNPDAPQQPVRAMALRDGKVLYMPTPRLRGSFLRIDPANVPAGEERRAASLSACERYGRRISLDEWLNDGLPSIDLVVTGCVAVAPDGGRLGKGEGYSDLEYAILRELGHPEVPVATTVHGSQVVERIPVADYDLTVDYIATPEGVIKTGAPYKKPGGVYWNLLDASDIERMPLLAELRRLKWERVEMEDVIAPGLKVLFVGLNPGRYSAGRGHHFAGPGNLFWRLLHESGFTPVVLRPDEDGQLLGYGYGITNLVSRPTRGEADLSWAEMKAGGERLREKVSLYRPALVALLGKQVYRSYAGLSRGASVSWGIQERETVPGVREAVLPNPSPRSTVPFDVRRALFSAVREFASPH